jgi:hypothetical protein
VTAAAQREERASDARKNRTPLVLGRSGLAVVALVSGVFILQHDLDQDYRWGVYVVSIGSAVVFWLLGRACKYFLAGE